MSTDVEIDGVSVGEKVQLLERVWQKARVTTRHQEWNGVPMPAVNRVEAVDLRENVVMRVQEYRFGTPRECTRPNDDFFLPRYGISDDPSPSMPLSCDVP